MFNNDKNHASMALKCSVYVYIQVLYDCVNVYECKCQSSKLVLVSWVFFVGGATSSSLLSSLSTLLSLN